MVFHVFTLLQSRLRLPSLDLLHHDRLLRNVVVLKSALRAHDRRWRDNRANHHHEKSSPSAEARISAVLS